MLKSERKEILNCHEKKFLTLIRNKQKEDGLVENPNNTIVNLSSRNFSDEELQVLRLGLKHGIALRPRDTDVFVSLEAVWDQIKTKELLKNNNHSEAKARTALQAYPYSVLDLEIIEFRHDSQSVKLIKKYL